MLVTPDDHRRAFERGMEDQGEDMDRHYNAGLSLSVIESRFGGQMRAGARKLAANLDPVGVAQMLRAEAELISPVGIIIPVEGDPHILNLTTRVKMIQLLAKAGYADRTIAAFTNRQEVDVARLRTMVSVGSGEPS